MGWLMLLLIIYMVGFKLEFCSFWSFLSFFLCLFLFVLCLIVFGLFRPFFGDLVVFWPFPLVCI
ncbi:hypothetical protein BDW72DRAFT_162564 [Aspergillus terricola var. indicus]